jgi:thiol-disulfide isomerase/thioredoxin
MSTKLFNMRGGNTQNYGVEQKSMFSKVASNAISYLSMKNFVIIGALAFFILIGVYYYNNHVAPKLKPSFKANNELMPSNSANTNGTNEVELFLFYADWCPHCKTAKPIWNEIKDEYENKKINGYNIVFTEVNCTTESAEVDKLMNQYKVEGFPTIKLLKDGQVIEYDAKPSRENLYQFLNTVI